MMGYRDERTGRASCCPGCPGCLRSRDLAISEDRHDTNALPPPARTASPHLTAPTVRCPPAAFAASPSGAGPAILILSGSWARGLILFSKVGPRTLPPQFPIDGPIGRARAITRHGSQQRARPFSFSSSCVAGARVPAGVSRCEHHAHVQRWLTAGPSAVQAPSQTAHTACERRTTGG